MKLLLLTILCMILFAANSLLCRLSLVEYDMDPDVYTAIRGVSAAVMLCLLGWMRTRRQASCKSWVWEIWGRGSWRSALSLFVYMVFFSWGYVGIPTAAGTLIFYVAVQFGMVGWGVYRGAYPTLM